ncbi:hypothetical protein LEP1GSC072_3109 [Leptospira noguchii str. Bonito]|nr:hypothetical protein LEP1GSC072_3109 [Leptospira noguchii str. Bonito]
MCVFDPSDSKILLTCGEGYDSAGTTNYSFDFQKIKIE